MKQKDPEIALSIRQPYCEQILIGEKTIEYRSKPTKRRGRVFIYASLKPGPEEEWEDMDMQSGDLPTGVLVGTIEIVDCTEGDYGFEWHLENPERLKVLRKPLKQPMPSFFFPF